MLYYTQQSCTRGTKLAVELGKHLHFVSWCRRVIENKIGSFSGTRDVNNIIIVTNYERQVCRCQSVELFFFKEKVE